MPPETTTSVLQFITVGGAAVAFFWVLRLIVEGKLHSSSEIDGLRQDKQDLLEINSKLSEALDKSNALLQLALERED